MINFSDKENISEIIELEKLSLKSTLEIQKNLNKQILMFIKKIMADVTFTSEINPEDKSFYYLNESTNALNKSNSNITILKKLADELEKINISNNQEFEEKARKYNENFAENINLIYSNTEIIEKFVYETSTTDIAEVLKTSKKEESEEEKISEEYIESSDMFSRFIENTLIISEVQQRVILPYTIKDVKEILLNDPQGYSSLQGVINKVYTKPIDYYKFSAISRFKEAYKLITEKEKGPKTKAIALGIELFLNYNLHPAIISACKSLDELDIYLACLEDNNLDEFSFFDIKYEIPPEIVKQAKNIII